MTSYRFKLLNGRILGPFVLGEIKQLIRQGIIKGNELVQVHPGGDWHEVSDNDEVNKMIISLLLESGEELDSTDVEVLKRKYVERDDIDELIFDDEIEESLKNESKNQYREFKFSKDAKDEFDYGELEEAYKKQDAEKAKIIEPTRVVNIKDIGNIDKTIVVSPAKIIEEHQAKEETQSEETSTKTILPEGPELPVVTSNDKTEFLDLSKLKSEYGDELSLARNYSETRIHIPDEIKKVKDDKIVEKKKIKPVVALAFIVLLYFLIFDEDGEEKQKVVSVNISTPVSKEVVDPSISHKLYEEGVKFYRKNTYQDKINAAYKFKESLEYKFNENPSLPFLIRAYAELLENASSRKKANLVVFRLIRISRAKVLKDVNVAYGSALFYRKLNKNQTALRVIENFLRVGKPSVDLLCLYGEILLDVGDFIKAKTVLDNLINLKNKTVEVYIFITRYYQIDQQLEKARNMVIEGGKNFPQSNRLMIKFAEMELQAQNYNSFENILRALTLTNSGGEPVLYAKYLELMGLLSSLKGNTKKAAVFLKSSLGLIDSPALRSRLAMLNIEGDKLSQALIKESKSINYLEISRKHINKKEWEEAFKFALEAVDMNPGFLPVELNLADLQIRRGYLEAAILKLESLKKVYPNSTHVLYRLIKAYLVARKFEKSKYEINYISTTNIPKDESYYSLLGYYYTKIERYTLAVKFYNKSIRMNPLQDDIYFSMAEIFMSGRKYAEAKKALTEAITLDPNNLEYRSLHSKIIFELDGPETAIGYLQDLVSENRDDPLLFGNIAIYYYKSGQIKQFEHYRKKLESLNKKDENFYVFMIESAELEGKRDVIINNCKELLKINPGNILIRMKLANYLSIVERYFEALKMYESILERLPGYPLANYYIGKIHIIQKKYKDALKSGEEEVKHNPTIYNGYYIIGEAYRLLEEYALSVKTLEKAISLSPRSVESLMALGWIKYKQNFLEIARELYIRAKNVEPNNPEIRRELGNIYVGIGQSTLAKEEFEIYLKLSPTAPDRQNISNKIKNLSR